MREITENKCQTRRRGDAEDEKNESDFIFFFFILNSEKILRLCVSALIILFLLTSAEAQSTNQSYPTAVTSNEISGAIKARDLGDARLTSYFYAFNGNQGDVFINVVANNFNGNIDVFTVNGLRLLTKIVVFADASVNETGRVIYLRKPERLILRVEGRTPNDDPATFRIKFAGSFQALGENEQPDAPDEPKVASRSDSDVRVNSVGTIIQVKPKSTPRETVAETKQIKKSVADETKAEESKKVNSEDVVQQISVETNTEKSVIAETNVKDKNERNIEVSEAGNKIEVSVTENASPQIEKQSENIERANPAVEEVKEPNISKTETIKPEGTAKTTGTTKNSRGLKRDAARKARDAKTAELNVALENIRLVVVLKDGAKIEKPMSEILRVGVDKGVLTVIAKDGTISRYSILDVAKMTIE
jgi:hypothetical protein